MRVVITGLGAVSCLGIGLDAVSESLKNGTSGIGIDPERVNNGFRSPLTGRLPPFNPRDYSSRKQIKSMGEPAQYALAAALEAVEQSGVTNEEWASPRAGLVVGNDSCAMPAVEAVDLVREHGETRFIGSGKIIQVMNSTVTMNLSTFFGVQGASWTMAAACASGAHAIGQAYMLIRAGLQDRVLCGGAQELSWHAMASFDALGAFAKMEDDPTTAARPFSAHRRGLVPSGGAAMLVVESLDSAKARGATILAEIKGYGFSCDGGHLTQPSGQGAVRAMRQCLENGGINREQIDYVNAHATGTPVGDLVEGRGILEVFGMDGPPVSSTKSMTGHECWMAGASEVLYSYLMMREGFLAPNINLGELEPELKGLNVVEVVRDAKPRRVLSNSFGFGGTNASILVSVFEG